MSDEPAPERAMPRLGGADLWLRILAPTVIAALFLGAWEAVVRINAIPHYILPAPSLVLATMVLDLPKEQRAKALRYGIIGAYVFRGICLLLAEQLIQIWWLKPIGGLYLLYLTFSYFKGLATTKDESDDVLDKKQNWFYRMTVGQIGVFWATIALVSFTASFCLRL